MAKSIKIKKKKSRRKISLLAKATFFFVLSLVFYFASSLYINVKVNEITINMQEMQAQIDVLKNENMDLTKDINMLSGKDRIYETAKENNMEINTDNVYAIASMGS